MRPIAGKRFQSIIPGLSGFLGLMMLRMLRIKDV